MLDVALTTVVGAVLIVVVFAVSTRLLVSDAADRSRGVHAAAWLGYALVAAAAAFSIWLIVPYFRG